MTSPRSTGHFWPVLLRIQPCPSNPSLLVPDQSSYSSQPCLLDAVHNTDSPTLLTHAHAVNGKSRLVANPAIAQEARGAQPNKHAYGFDCHTRHLSHRNVPRYVSNVSMHDQWRIMTLLPRQLYVTHPIAFACSRCLRCGCEFRFWE